jgi:hypothetical protein
VFVNHQDSEQGQQVSEVLQQELEVLPELEQVQEQVLQLEQGLAALRFEAAQAEELVQVLLQGVEQGQERVLEPQEHLAQVIQLDSVRRKVRG